MFNGLREVVLSVFFRLHFIRLGSLLAAFNTPGGPVLPACKPGRRVAIRSSPCLCFHLEAHGWGCMEVSSLPLETSLIILTGSGRVTSARHAETEFVQSSGRFPSGFAANATRLPGLVLVVSLQAWPVRASLSWPLTLVSTDPLGTPAPIY